MRAGVRFLKVGRRVEPEIPQLWQLNLPVPPMGGCLFGAVGHSGDWHPPFKVTSIALAVGLIAHGS